MQFAEMENNLCGWENDKYSCTWKQICVQCVHQKICEQCMDKSVLLDKLGRRKYIFYNGENKMHKDNGRSEDKQDYAGNDYNNCGCTEKPMRVPETFEFAICGLICVDGNTDICSPLPRNLFMCSFRLLSPMKLSLQELPFQKDEAQKSWAGRLRLNLWDAMGGQPRYVLLHHGVHDLLDPAPVLLVYYVPCGACARSACLQCPIRGVLVVLVVLVYNVRSGG